MTQIKLSIAFVLAAAAIAPIVAQPILHATPHHDHRPSAQELAEEFELRDLIISDSTMLNKVENDVKTLARQDSQLESQHKLLMTQNGNLQRADRALAKTEQYLQQKDRGLQSEGKRLEGINDALKGQNKFLSGKKQRLTKVDNKLGRERKGLARKDNVFGRKQGFPLHQNKVLKNHNGVLRKGLALAPKNKAVAHKKFGPREFDDSDDLFERAESEDGAANNAAYKVARNSFCQIFKSHGTTIPKFCSREFDESEDMLERDLEDSEFDAREFDESEYMLERDLKDYELDAREFEDELYLD